MHDRHARRFAAAASLLAVLTLALAACSRAPEPTRLSGKALGTSWNVILPRLPHGVDRDAARRAVENALARVNASMSTFDKDSDISRFNRETSGEWFPVSAETADVVLLGLDVARLTGGAFDPSVGPLVSLWGFGPEMRPEKVPSDEAIASAKARVGAGKLHARREPPALRKDRPELVLDLAAIAKGFAVDQAAAALEGLGCASYFVEVGGEIRVAGRKADDSRWSIGVEKPVVQERSVQKIIALTDMGMATSGDYRNFFEQDGVRYSHIIDPATGKPIAHKLVSVSVLDPSCARADALATGLMVLGPDKGLELARGLDLAAYFIVKADNGFIESTTAAFDRAVQQR